MYRKITPAQVTEAGAVFGSVAVFQICYIGCKLVWGRQEIATGYGVGFAICILVLLAGLVFAVIFASVERNSPTNGAANLVFSAWKASTLLAIHFLEFLEIVIAFFKSYPEDARKERHTVLGIIVFLHAGVLFAALWLLFYSGLELLGITPALTQICIALLALRFTSMLGQPTPFTLRRLSSLAAAATLASVASTFLVLSSLIGWNRRDLACHSSICMGMLILRPATTAWAWVSKQALLERRKERHITLGGDTSQQSLHRIESSEQVA